MARARALVNKAKLRGISKNRVLMGCAIVIIVLLGVLLFSGSDLDSQTFDTDMVADNTTYANSVNLRDSTNNIIAKVSDTRKLLVNQAVTSGVDPVVTAAADTSKIEVPPIIKKVSNDILHNNNPSSPSSSGNLESVNNIDAMNSIGSTNGIDSIENIVENQLAPNLKQIKQRVLRQRLENGYASNHAKSVVFNNTKLGGGVANNSSETSLSATASGMGNAISANVIGIANNADYLQSELNGPISRYELKAGSIIPATMINGLNSDLPGEVIAFIRSNVYDSANRRYTLIPQGSRLVGMYDSQIIYGQERVAVAWHRLIYPDGSSINLKAMLGSDLEGYSGFHDKVDNKYWRIFGASFIMGVITGAMQYSQNNINNNASVGNNNASINPTIGQTMAGSLGQQLGQTGLTITQKNLNIQPTLIIRPNYPFSIMTTADMVLKPWRNL
jgi:type IV secretory pathway VirB10-like protein